MQTDIRAQASRQTPISTEPARNRRWGVVVVGALTVVLLAWAWLVWGTHPICGSECGGVGGVVGSSATRLGRFTSPSGEDFTAYRVRHAPGRALSFWLTLTNTGLVDTTVTAIGRDDTWPLTSRIETSSTEGTAGRNLDEFQPFSLPADGHMNVLVTVRMQGCMAADASLSIGVLPVDYRILGVTRSTTVTLPQSIEVVGRPGNQCR